MTRLLDGGIIVLLVLVAGFVYDGNYLGYNNCMKATKAEYISKKGIAHILS